MLSTKPRPKTKKTYSFTLNEKEMKKFKENNPELNVSNMIDNLIKAENEKKGRKTSYPFADLADDFGISFDTPEEEAEFDKFFGLDELEKQWDEYNKENDETK